MCAVEAGKLYVEAFLEIFQKVTIGHRYHFFALHAIWSCFGAWKTTFWAAWSFEFCKPQYWSYMQTLEAEASMSPYLKSFWPDFWYCHYFLKKLNFSTSYEQNPSKMLKNFLQNMQNSWKKNFWSKNSNLPNSFYMLPNDVESIPKWFWGPKTSISTIDDT